MLIPAFSDTFIKINKITNEQSAINTHFLDNADGCFNGYNPEYSYSTGAFAALNSYEFIVQRTYDGKAAVINVDDINTENIEAENCREFYIKISDIDLERKILKNIFNNYKDTTIIIISHRLNNLDLFDKVLKLEDCEITTITRSV